MEKEAIRTYTKEGTCVCQKELETAIKDGMERLLMPSIENEVRSDLSERAHNKSIEIFAKNLEQLLSQPALKGRVVLGFDPGYYNGCKLAVIDATGKLLQADIAVSVTGLAGPGGDAFGHEVGTVYIGYDSAPKSVAKRYVFSGDRESVRQQAIEAALKLILEMTK